MTLAVLMVLVAQFLYGVSNTVDAFISNTLFKKVPTIVFYNGILNLLSIPIILMFGIPKMFPLDVNLIILLCLSALLEVLYQFPYYKSLKTIDTSIVTSMFSLGKVIIPLSAYYILGEKLEAIHYIGFFIIILCNIILNLDFSQKNTFKNVFSYTFWLMLIVAFLLSFQNVLDKKVLLDVDWITLAFWFVILTSILNFSIILFPKNRADIIQSAKIYKKNFKVFLFMDLNQQSAMVLLVAALSALPVVVLEALNSTQPIFVLLIGIILHKIYGDKFKEHISKKDIIKKLICFTFIILGIILTVLGGKI